mgnify:CR=1 FL=1
MAIYCVLPAGTYWIGDPCYTFPNEGNFRGKWNELLEVTEYFTISFGELDNGKIKVWADNTAYGDGEYTSSEGHRFGVDSGLLGIIPKETTDYLGKDVEKLERLGLFKTFDQPFTIQFCDGYFEFGELTILTGTKNYLKGYDEDYEDYVDEDYVDED